MFTSPSTTSLSVPRYSQNVAPRLAQEVIEEVDEQLTIQSMRAQEQPRPTAQSIFAKLDEKAPPQPIRSAPIDVPGTHHNQDQINYDRAQSVMNPERTPFLFPNNELFSTSAPETSRRPPTINIDMIDDIENPKPNVAKSN